MKKINLIVVAFCVLGFISCQNSNTNNPETSSPSVSSVLEVEQKVTALLKQMTLEEKIGQMNQYNGFWDLTGPAPSTGAAAKKTRTPPQRLCGVDAQCKRRGKCSKSSKDRRRRNTLRHPPNYRV